MLHTRTTFVPYNWPVKESDVVFMGIPFVSTASSFAAPYGPLMVRQSLAFKEDFIKDAKTNLFEKVKVCDVGDIAIVPGSFESTSNKIKETISHIEEENKPRFWIFIGGDHSVSLPIVDSLKPKTLIILDAHTDLNDDDDEQTYSKYNHATWVRHVDPSIEIYHIGLRSWSRSSFEASKRSKHITVDELEKMKFKPPIHLSIDIDFFDPAYIGKTGYPEGIMKPQDAFRVLNAIQVDSMDIVEIADIELPSKAGFLAAELIKRALAHSLLNIKVSL